MCSTCAYLDLFRLVRACSIRLPCPAIDISLIEQLKRVASAKEYSVKTPTECANMADIREAIDEIDRDLVARIAIRVGYITRAAEIKRQNELPARIQSRVDEVVENVVRAAEAINMPGDLVAPLWTAMIEWSIRHEERLMSEAQGHEQASQDLR